MSICSEVEGTVMMANDSHFSVRKAWQSLYDELSYSEDVEHCPHGTKTKFRVAVSLDGMAAASVVDEFVEALEGNKGCLWSQIHANIRFT